MIPAQAVEAAAKASHASRWPNAPWDALNDDARTYARENARLALEAAAPHMLSGELAAEYRRGYRDGLTDRKQVTAEPREWEPGDPIE